MSHDLSYANSSLAPAKGEATDAMETKTGVVIAIFAAALAVNGLGSSKFGDDEQNAIIEKSNQYNWYQSKSIKKSLAEGQAEMLRSLKEAGVIAAGQHEPVDALVVNLNAKSLRYDREAKIILQGSGSLKGEAWFGQMDPDMQEVVGANEIHQKAIELGRAGDYFDLSDLFLQLCVVVGAICLVVKRHRLKQQFYIAMILLGIIGAASSALAFRAAGAHF